MRECHAAPALFHEAGPAPGSSNVRPALATVRVSGPSIKRGGVRDPDGRKRPPINPATPAPITHHNRSRYTETYDPYAVCFRQGILVDTFCNHQRQGLWVPRSPGRRRGSIPELFAQDALFQAVAGVEQHPHRNAPVRNHLDAADVAGLVVVGDRGHGTLFALEHFDDDKGGVGEQGAAPAPRDGTPRSASAPIVRR